MPTSQKSKKEIVRRKNESASSYMKRLQKAGFTIGSKKQKF